MGLSWFIFVTLKPHEFIGCPPKFLETSTMTRHANTATGVLEGPSAMCKIWPNAVGEACLERIAAAAVEMDGVRCNGEINGEILGIQNDSAESRD